MQPRRVAERVLNVKNVSKVTERAVITRPPIKLAEKQPANEPLTDRFIENLPISLRKPRQEVAKLPTQSIKTLEQILPQLRAQFESIVIPVKVLQLENNRIVSVETKERRSLALLHVPEITRPSLTLAEAPISTSEESAAYYPLPSTGGTFVELPSLEPQFTVLTEDRLETVPPPIQSPEEELAEWIASESEEQPVFYKEQPSLQDETQLFENTSYIDWLGTGQSENKIGAVELTSTQTEVPNLQIQEFALILGYTESAEEAGRPIAEQDISLGDTPLHEAAPELPAICVEVIEKFSALDPEPAHVAREMLVKITNTVEEVVLLRRSGHEEALAAEQELEALCIELFDYLGVEYTPETIMQFVSGIMEARQFAEQEQSNQAREEHIDEGMREFKRDDGQGMGVLLQLASYSLSHTLGILTVHLTQPQAASI